MPNRTRNRPFSVRLSDEEYAIWEKKYKACKLSKVDYFVRLLHGSTIKVFSFSQAINSLYSELRKIGVNLNQIAVLANSGYLQQAENEIASMHKSYTEVMERLKAFLDKPPIEISEVK